MYYTYLWLREDGTPYYAGKGKNRRATNPHSIGKTPPKERIVIYPAESEQDAFDTEIALIWYYGRKDKGTGCLRNFTDGGEGSSGNISRKTLDFLGKTFGSLVVLERAPATAGDAHATWLCRCTCGEETKVRSMHLKSGRVVSCGCGKYTMDEKVNMSIAQSRRWARVRAAHA
jgi:hypothetical protein